MIAAHLSRTADAATATSRLKLFEGDFYGAGALAASFDVSADGKLFLMARRIDTRGGS